MDKFTEYMINVMMGSLAALSIVMVIVLIKLAYEWFFKKEDKL